MLSCPCGWVESRTHQTSAESCFFVRRWKVSCWRGAKDCEEAFYRTKSGRMKASPRWLLMMERTCLICVSLCWQGSSSIEYMIRQKGHGTARCERRGNEMCGCKQSRKKHHSRGKGVFAPILRFSFSHNPSI